MGMQDAGDDNEESTEFNADANVDYVQKTCELYGIVYNTRVLCQCADSAAVNIKLAWDTPHCHHISWKNHNLSLGAGKVVS